MLFRTLSFYFYRLVLDPLNKYGAAGLSSRSTLYLYFSDTNTEMDLSAITVKKVAANSETYSECRGPQPLRVGTSYPPCFEVRGFC
jgi:hypothetical protein